MSDESQRNKEGSRGKAPGDEFWYLLLCHTSMTYQYSTSIHLLIVKGGPLNEYSIAHE